MEGIWEDESASVSARARKKRVPKACGSCRQSKLRCDGLRPCSRCRGLRKVCEFVERPKDPYESKMEALRIEVDTLKTQLNTIKTPSVANSVPSPNSWSSMALDDMTVNLSQHRSDMVGIGGLDVGSHSRGQTRVVPTNDMAYVGLTNNMSSLPCAAASSVDSPDTSGHMNQPLHTAAGTTTTGIARLETRKRRRSHFEAATPPTAHEIDPISAGLITPEAAASYFATFFSGCDRYVPVFDPVRHDTFEGVRSRSAVLFSAICSVGCRILTGSESHQSRILGVHTQRVLNVAIASGDIGATLETVQALLVRACYASERSLLVAVATRMAVGIGLPEAYGAISTRSLHHQAGTMAAPDDEEDDATLMRKTRAWLHLLMMGQILHVDAGGPPGFRFRGAAQRCRVLLDNPASTGIDLYLFSQVELNTLRARIHSAFHGYARNRHRRNNHRLHNLQSPYTASTTTTTNEEESDTDADIMDMASDAKVDLSVWFDDWTRIYERHQASMPWLAPNLAVQRCWADSMAMCCALRAAGVEDVSAMSSAQRRILLMAKGSLARHLDIVLEEPRLYLRSIRHAMDFVWAKNAFCYLLLLKLSLLLPDDGGEVDESGSGGGDGAESGGAAGGTRSSSDQELIEKGCALVEELSRAGGGLADGARNDTSSLYLRLVRVSIQKFSHATRGTTQDASLDGQGRPGIPPKPSYSQPAPTARPGSVNLRRHGQERADPHIGAVADVHHDQGRREGEETGQDGQEELQSFVPEQFVFEWDFPGLTFFSSPTPDTGWLDDLLAGAFEGTDNFYGMGWPSMDLSG